MNSVDEAKVKTKNKGENKMKIKEWNEHIKTLNQEDRDELVAALEQLKRWTIFKEAFEWTGIFNLIKIIEFTE